MPFPFQHALLPSMACGNTRHLRNNSCLADLLINVSVIILCHFLKIKQRSDFKWIVPQAKFSTGMIDMVTWFSKADQQSRNL